MSPSPLSPEISELTASEHRLRNGIMVGATLARLGLLPELVESIHSHSITRTAGMVGAVIAADVVDGVIARKLHTDTNVRRITDAVVDRVSILTAFGAAATQNPEVLAWYAPLAVRGGVIATGSNLCFWLRNKLVLGGDFHKLASLSMAALGTSLVAEVPNEILFPVAATTYAIGSISVLDYIGAHKQQLMGKKADVLERVRVTGLSGLRSLFAKKWKANY